MPPSGGGSASAERGLYIHAGCHIKRGRGPFRKQEGLFLLAQGRNGAAAQGRNGKIIIVQELPITGNPIPVNVPQAHEIGRKAWYHSFCRPVRDGTIT